MTSFIPRWPERGTGEELRLQSAVLRLIFGLLSPALRRVFLLFTGPFHLLHPHPFFHRFWQQSFSRTVAARFQLHRDVFFGGCFFFLNRKEKNPDQDKARMGLTISSLFSRLFGKKQMRILMGEPRAALTPRYSVFLKFFPAQFGNFSDGKTSQSFANEATG